MNIWGPIVYLLWAFNNIFIVGLLKTLFKYIYGCLLYKLFMGDF